MPEISNCGKISNDESIERIPIACRINNNLSNEDSYPIYQVSNYLNNDLNNDFINHHKLQQCWKYSSGLRFVTGVDILFCFINGFFYNPYWLLTSIMPLCGYQGAIQFCSIKIMFYLIYLYTSWFGKLIQIILIVTVPVYISNSTNTTVVNGIELDDLTIVSLFTSSCIIQLCIAIYTSIFICQIYKLTSLEIIYLRNKVKDKNIKECLCC
jgi:hypothetical protein